MCKMSVPFSEIKKELLNEPTGVYGYRDEHGTDRSIESTICRNYRTYSCSRLGTPEDMKGPCVFLASDASDYLNGAIISVDGGYLVK